MIGIPQWAKERVVELTNADGEEPLSLGIMEYRHALAFARYIAAHEEPPVDPLLIEAREFAIGLLTKTVVANGNPCGNQEIRRIREGCGDSNSFVTDMLAALRRGIELAKEQSS